MSSLSEELAIYDELQAFFSQPDFAAWGDRLPAQLARAFSEDRHGDWPKWREVLLGLPACVPERVDLGSAAITVAGDCSTENREHIERLLRELHPWRKGPYDVFGIHIDTEWRSDLKWDRLSGTISPLRGRTVLDVGCGSG